MNGKRTVRAVQCNGCGRSTTWTHRVGAVRRLCSACYGKHLDHEREEREERAEARRFAGW